MLVPVLRHSDSRAIDNVEIARVARQIMTTSLNRHADGDSSRIENWWEYDLKSWNVLLYSCYGLLNCVLDCRKILELRVCVNRCLHGYARFGGIYIQNCLDGVCSRKPG